MFKKDENWTNLTFSKMSKSQISYYIWHRSSAYILKHSQKSSAHKKWLQKAKHANILHLGSSPIICILKGSTKPNLREIWPNEGKKSEFLWLKRVYFLSTKMAKNGQKWKFSNLNSSPVICTLKCITKLNLREIWPAVNKCEPNI